MDHDALLKSILESLSNLVVPRLIGATLVEQLNVEFATVKKRIPDLVARLDDGRILHLELQTANDPRMAERMLEYWLLLNARYPRTEIVQTVLYVGGPRMRMRPGISLENLQFRYSLRNIREIDAEELLASESASERVLAVLCRTRGSRKTIRRVIGSWRGLPKDEWSSLYERLMVTSGLRGLEKAVEEEVENMPLTIDIINNNTVIQGWIEKGKRMGIEEGREQGIERGREQGIEQGEAALLRRLIERKFGALPVWAGARLEAAKPKTIEKWALRILDAKTLEQLFR